MKKKYYRIMFISLIILAFYILFLYNKGLIAFLLVLYLIILTQFFLSFIISTIFDTYENRDKIDKQKYYKRFLNFFNEYLKINEKNFIKLWKVYFLVSIFIWIIPFPFNENALEVLTTILALLEGSLIKKNVKSKAFSNILYIMFLYLLIILVGEFIKGEPYNKFEFNKNFNSFYLQYDLFFTLIRAYLLAILFVKAFQIFFFFSENKK
ncbi:hypothetical protein [Fusobacterium massiliense]|uniref:hypothetical protein n=1 Tax=Fusobacterium massiliense TaxID=1852365 RepID=UPI00093DC12C|nr:hypothetical protein [Fusobacterium massiliense]